MRRYALLGFLALAILGLGGIAVELVLMRGRTPLIAGERSVALLEKIRLGGAEQWILIRGHDRTKPVLLFLHGGPGMPTMFLSHAFQRELERDFVVVHWDRRGAGKSFEAAFPLESLSVHRMLEDTYELTRMLRERFSQDRIYLVAHSWGTYLGLLAIQGHPEYYSAYIGMGQLAGSRTEVWKIRREFIIRKATEAGDSELIHRLMNSDYEITEDDLFRYGGELYNARSFWPILIAGLRAPEYTLLDALNVKKGADLVAQEMRYDIPLKPLEGEITEFDIPVYFFLGRHDYNTPSTLAADYLKRLHSPLKGLIWFEYSAHFPFFEEPVKFHAEMRRIDAAVREFWMNRGRATNNSQP